MQNFFKYLIYANGMLLFLLSLYILADIWFIHGYTGTTTWKVIGSYFLLLINFLIFYRLKVISRQHELEDLNN